MIFSHHLIVRFVLLGAVFCLLALPLKAANLVPHRAIYSLKMGKTEAGSSFVDAQGAMTLVMEKSCDGWILTQDLSMNLSTFEGQVVSQRSRFTGLESLDGKKYRFLSNNESMGEIKHIKGKAQFKEIGGIGEVFFDLPEKTTMKLPKGTFFPVAQTAWVIDQAIAGVRHAPHFSFDGADGTGSREAVAFIGPLFYPSKAKGKASLGPLSKRPGWNIRMAFYPLDSRAAEPEYEMEILQLDNGVARRMLLDYGNLTVILKLEKIEAIKPPSC